MDTVPSSAAIATAIVVIFILNSMFAGYTRLSTNFYEVTFQIG